MMKFQISEYTETELIALAKRKNNPKRGFLIVNPLQGKHIPVSPEKPLKLFKKLASLLKDRYPNEMILFIGFAETATAIGASVAFNFSEQSRYIHTTRECVELSEKIVDFSEEHSHATEQKLFCSDWKSFIDGVDRIVFVEDELTTGKTILNFVEALKSGGFIGGIEVAVASIMNGMNEGNITRFIENGIQFHYILKIDIEDYASVNIEIDEDGIEFNEIDNPMDMNGFNELIFNGAQDPRIGVCIGEYEKACEELALRVISTLGQSFFENNKILVLGTEEFMHPAINLAYSILTKCSADSVKTHSTTRSPISMSNLQKYPINQRYKLKSFYDEQRETYIYNLGKYDEVLIVTDSAAQNAGTESLLRALHSCENRNISLIRWEK